MLEKFKNKFKKKGEVYLRIKVRPGSAETAIKEILDDETIKIDVAAPAEKGKANAELMKFLVKKFGINKDSVKIISGAGERVKLVKIVNNF